MEVIWVVSLVVEVVMVSGLGIMLDEWLGVKG